MLDSIMAQKSSREVWLFLGMRNRSEHALKAQLEALANRCENLRLMVCYSEPSSDCRFGQDYHRRGIVSIDLLRSVLPSNNYDFYFCGPPGMMNSLHEGLSMWGVPSDRLHFEAFGPATVGKNPTQTTVANPSASFEVKFIRSDKTLHWRPPEGSLLDFAERHGISIESGCRSGNCGTCVTAIRTGEVDYPSQPSEMPDNGACLRVPLFHGRILN